MVGSAAVLSGAVNNVDPQDKGSLFSTTIAAVFSSLYFFIKYKRIDGRVRALLEKGELQPTLLELVKTDPTLYPALQPISTQFSIFLDEPDTQHQV